MNWNLYFYKTHRHQILQAGISKGLGSNDTNQAGAGEAITQRSRNKLEMLYYH